MSTSAYSPLPAPVFDRSASHQIVDNWLRSPGIPGSGLYSPGVPPCAMDRRSSAPVVTVVRNGRVYTSRKTPAGELNARERRKQRRALERVSISQSVSATSEDPTAVADESQDVPCPEVTTRQRAQTVNERPHLNSPRYPFGESQESIQAHWATYEPFGSQEFKFPSAGPSATQMLLSAQMDPNVPADQRISWVPATHMRIRKAFPAAPPPSPCPSSSEDDSQNTATSSSPESPPASPTLSRRSSLNVDAAPFVPTRICPNTPRSPSRSARPRPVSLTLDSSNSNVIFVPIDASNLTERMPQGRRHSMATAAWEVHQRRLSDRYASPEYQPLPPSATAPDPEPSQFAVELVHPPQVQSMSPMGSPSAVYLDTEGRGFPSPLSSPRSSTFLTHSPAASDFACAGAAAGNRSHIKTGSGTSLPGLLHRHSAGFEHVGRTSGTGPKFDSWSDRSARSSLSGSISSVYAECGEDPEVDHLADLRTLVALTDQSYQILA